MYIQGKRTNSYKKEENTTTNFLLNVPLKDEAGFQCIKQKCIYIELKKKRKIIQKRNQLPVIDEIHSRKKSGFALPETNTPEIIIRIS